MIFRQKVLFLSKFFIQILIMNKLFILAIISIMASVTINAEVLPPVASP